MAISGISSAAPSIRTTPSVTPSAGQSAFSQDVANLQQNLMALNSGEGAGKARHHKAQKSSPAADAGTAGDAGQAADAGQAGDAGAAGGADIQNIAQMLQKLVQMLSQLLSKLQGAQGSTKAPAPGGATNIDVAPGLADGGKTSGPSASEA